MNQQPNRSEAGNALVAVMVSTIAISGLLYGSLTTTAVDMRSTVRSVDDVRTMSLAQAGVEQTIALMRNAAQKLNTMDPMQGIRNLFTAGPYAALTAAPVTISGRTYGQCTATATAVVNQADRVVVTIDSTGYYPVAPANAPEGSERPRQKSVRVTVEFNLERSRVFESSYFINNWGWFYGTNIYCNGNARSNGAFDCANYGPTVTGQPTYDDLTWDGGDATLSGYRDDNGDGLQNGLDGGMFAGWSIAGSNNVKGTGGTALPASNKHQFAEQNEMPNLTNLEPYEARAIAQGSTISVGGNVLVNGVYGDTPGEKQHLYLIGTAANPIVINGPVVVRGSVVLAGVIKGQGAIYSGGNVYVPNNLQYADAPSTSRPANNTQAATETWLEANRNKDFVAIMARENVVLGDHTNGTWRSYVSSWLAHAMNKSREDAGEDGIPNTRKGRDGILNTADDDVLEDDGQWTVQRYTADDLARGLIPAGKSVNDPIPGTGEDIDGDGAYDNTLTIANLDLPAALNTTNWGGTITGSVTFSSIASGAMTRLDGAFYTNHAFAWLTTPSSAIHMNGAMVSRNESVIYGGPGLHMNYDARLLGGSNTVLGDLLPKTLAPVIVRDWTTLPNDPHAACLAGGSTAP